jgi:glycosyltransferase involved in cell wall biosynthesis
MISNTCITVSVLIPAHNEEKRIGKTLENHLDFFHNTEIFIAMDGCKDKTQYIVEEFARNGNANNNLISYITFEQRLGKGMGMLRAIEHTKGDILVITDADESTPPSEISKLVNSLDGCDCVIGSRWLPESKVLIKQSIQRRIASRGFNFLVRKMFGIPFKDTQCGAKAIRKDAIKSVIKNMSTFNFAFDVDLVYQLQKKGFRIKEVPIVWSDKEGSSINLFPEIMTMFLAIIRLRIINSPLGFLIKNNVITYIYSCIRRDRCENRSYIDISSKESKSS